MLITSDLANILENYDWTACFGYLVKWIDDECNVAGFLENKHNDLPLLEQLKQFENVMIETGKRLRIKRMWLSLTPLISSRRHIRFNMETILVLFKACFDDDDDFITLSALFFVLECFTTFVHRVVWGFEDELQPLEKANIMTLVQCFIATFTKHASKITLFIKSEKWSFNDEMVFGSILVTNIACPEFNLFFPLVTFWNWEATLYDFYDDRNRNLLETALFHDNIAVVEWCLCNEVIEQRVPTLTQENIKDCFVLACSCEHLTLMDFLLPQIKEGVDFTLENLQHMKRLQLNHLTCLHVAVDLVKIKSAEWLLRHGADVNIMDRRRLFFEIAAKRGCLSMMKLFKPFLDLENIFVLKLDFERILCSLAQEHIPFSDYCHILNYFHEEVCDVNFFFEGGSSFILTRAVQSNSRELVNWFRQRVVSKNKWNTELLSSAILKDKPYMLDYLIRLHIFDSIKNYKLSNDHLPWVEFVVDRILIEHMRNFLSAPVVDICLDFLPRQEKVMGIIYGCGKI